MVEGRRKEAWSHTSAIICLIYNALSKEPMSPDDFNPYSNKKKTPVRKIGFDELKEMFFGGGGVELERGSKRK